MSGETSKTDSAQLTKLFICCLTFCEDQDVADAEAQNTSKEGTFQIVIHARDANDAAAKCRARLHQISSSTSGLGPIVVYANALVEVPFDDLVRGVAINQQELGDLISYNYLPDQGDTGAAAHLLDDEDAPLDESEVGDSGQEIDDDEGDSRTIPIFWAKWKLYWCETEDHDEDWFIVARTGWEARALHERLEGYDEGEAEAELVCVLPDPEQLAAERERGGWPSHETLLACGAELIPYTPQDGHDGLREYVGSGSRVVRINGRVYAEGDMVSNTLHHLGDETDA